MGCSFLDSCAESLSLRWSKHPISYHMYPSIYKAYEYKSSLLPPLWFIFSDFTMILLCLRTLPICDRSFQKWVRHPSYLPWKQQMLLFVLTLPTSRNVSWVWNLGIHESQELGFSHTMVLSKSVMTYCFLKLSKSNRYLPYTSLMTFFFFHPFYTESVEGDQSSVTLSPFPGKNWCRDTWMLWRSWISDLEQCRSKFWLVIL